MICQSHECIKQDASTSDNGAQWSISKNCFGEGMHVWEPCSGVARLKSYLNVSLQIVFSRM